ncbi:hypothetical protein [Sphingosinicella terrae]|jgi:hypothetical protein|uniref:hypothetical protein n=1 Tax=Sphingosinicella terrae TaxID=2172047 RepID=UPI000E0DE943|nr:hypothetical protein [Sphingosinicella terrae]
MEREPAYPDDAPVGTPAPAKGSPGEDPSAAEDSNPTEESSRTRNIVTGAAIGIGSAALVAALLYANRSRKGDKSRK